MKNLLFVDDEPRVLQGLQRQLRPMRNQWQMNFADSGPKALELLAEKPCDVIVTDMMMPGMDGAQLLTEIMARYPDTVRLVLSGHSEREAVMRLVGPAHQYLSKPCNAEELQSAISRTLATRDLLSNAQLKRVVSRLPSLPTLPSQHLQLTKELQSEEPSIERISQIVSRDIGMTSKILQLVNSAFFGLAQPASNVADAVSYLGLNTLRGLVLSLQVFSQFDRRTLHEFSIDAMADHCWTTGVFARRIAAAEKGGQILEDQCFLAGMLHDMGFLILAAGLPDLFAEVMAAASRQERPFWEEESARLGTTHAELGAYLLGLWGLPNPVVEAVAFHHHPFQCACPGFAPVFAVYVADWYAHKSCPGHPESHPSPLNLECLRTAGLRDHLGLWEQQCQHDPAKT